MTGMELYSRFMFTLAVGLAGVGIVLVTLLETLFHEWNPVVDFRRWWRDVSHRHHGAGSVRAEDILSELEGRRKKGDIYAARPPARAPSPDFVEAL
ncbi:MAG: hypothetical protein ACHQ49_11070 [Elusimicrobiota bacterium]